MRDMLITLGAGPINLGFCDSQETCSEIFKVVGVLLLFAIVPGVASVS